MTIFLLIYMENMDKFFIEWPRSRESFTALKVRLNSKSSKKNISIDFNLDDIVSNLRLRKPIEDFDVGIRDPVE